MEAALRLAREVKDLLASATLIGLPIPNRDALEEAVEDIEELAASRGIYL